MILTTAFGWGNLANVVVSTLLAFMFGYTLTMRGVLRHGLSLQAAAGIALAADTVSIAVMELVDNGTILIIPGAIDAQLTSALFWISLLVSLAIAYAAALPVNRALMARGLGHARAHMAHGSHH